MSIDLHSEKPCFSVEFVDRYFMKLGVEELGVGELAGAGSQWGQTPLQKNVDNLGGGRRSARPLRAGRAAGRSRAEGPGEAKTWLGGSFILATKRNNSHRQCHRNQRYARLGFCTQRTSVQFVCQPSHVSWCVSCLKLTHVLHVLNG